ncbi:hypothetical protein AB4X15_03005 [Peribacillus simplex]|uniref:hypothetical protein n=1 Tax=Peribacillus simplex TaxID=1478 RepID=UPI0034E852D5
MTETKTYLIGDKKYIEVDRAAKVGDKIVIVDASYTGGTYVNGDFLTVTTSFGTAGVRCEEIANERNYGGQVDPGEYRVLEQVEPTPDIHDLLANLAQRVTSLERITGTLVRAKFSLESQIRDTQNNVQTFAEQTEANTKDIKFLDDRTYVPEKPTKSAEEILCEISKILERDDRRCGR